MTDEERDKEEAISEMNREALQKPTINIYNEEANGGRWWEKKQWNK